jgi:hypothetical protein
MEPAVPLPCSQKPTNGPYPELSQDLYQEKEFSTLYRVVILYEEPPAFRWAEPLTESTVLLKLLPSLQHHDVT